MTHRKKKLPQTSEKVMSISDHIEELRWRIIAILIIITCLTFIIFFFSSNIHFIVYKTLSNIIDYPLILNNTYGGLQVLIKISFYCAILVGWPIILTILWRFVIPALSTRRSIWLGHILVLTSSIFFFFGVFFSWKYLIPFSNQFLLVDTLPQGVIPQLSIERYYAFAFMLFFTSGLIFQIPILFIVLGLTNLVQFQWHKKYWRLITVLTFIIAALITPPDPMSQMLLAGMLLFMYAMTLGLLYVIEHSRSK